MCHIDSDSKYNINIKVTFSKLSHKRLRLHIPDAGDNVIPYEIYPTPVSNRRILKAKRLSAALTLCTGSPDTVADKLRHARLTADIRQAELAGMLEVDRATLLRYENGQVSEENMQVDLLLQAALLCGQDKYFCCNPYYVFIAKNAGRQIKQYRKENHLTQRQLAEICKVSVCTVKRWERNEHRPSLQVWKLISGSEL